MGQTIRSGPPPRWSPTRIAPWAPLIWPSRSCRAPRLRPSTENHSGAPPASAASGAESPALARSRQSASTMATVLPIRRDRARQMSASSLASSATAVRLVWICSERSMVSYWRRMISRLTTSVTSANAMSGGPPRIGSLICSAVSRTAFGIFGKKRPVANKIADNAPLLSGPARPAVTGGEEQLAAVGPGQDFGPNMHPADLPPQAAPSRHGPHATEDVEAEHVLDGG